MKESKGSAQLGRMVKKPKSFKAKKDKPARTQIDKEAEPTAAQKSGEEQQQQQKDQKQKKVKKGDKGDHEGEKPAKGNGQEAQQKRDLEKSNSGKKEAENKGKGKKRTLAEAENDEEEGQGGRQPAEKGASGADKRPVKKAKVQAAEQPGQNGSESKGTKKQQQQQQKPPEESTEGGQKKRYLVFVGNLPYDTNEREIHSHFKSVGKITAIRLRDQKGFAFLEFDDPATHVKALKFHHSMFRDRKINVEMTAGGGGNSTKRKQKITEKNKKFQEEWAKKIAEKEAQEQQEAQAAGQSHEGGDDF